MKINVEFEIMTKDNIEFNFGGQDLFKQMYDTHNFTENIVSILQQLETEFGIKVKLKHVSISDNTTLLTRNPPAVKVSVHDPAKGGKKE